jgi:hypothetical protein
VVAGSWFDASDLAVKLRNSGITYVWEIKSNRKAKKGPGRHKSWKCLSYLFSGMERQQVNSEKNKWISERLIVLKSKSTQKNPLLHSIEKMVKMHSHIMLQPIDACLGQRYGKFFGIGGISNVSSTI